MLAYVFWHRPGDESVAPPDERAGGPPGPAHEMVRGPHVSGPADAYEAALAVFHRALRADPPAGFRGSAALRLDAAPWLEGEGVAYEDWYLVDDWTALGALNAHAASGARAPAHDAVAQASGHGAGAVYALLTGPPVPPSGGRTLWLSKPSGTARAAFHEELARRAGQAWQRQMVLGPAPEYAVVGGVVPWPAAEVRFVAVA
jgi:hypothetical protein